MQTKRLIVSLVVVAVVCLVVLVAMIAFLAVPRVKEMKAYGVNSLEMPLENNLEQEFANLKIRFDGVTRVTDPSIFIAISSYRDKELVHTLNDLYRKAYNPARIFVGVVQQNNYDDLKHEDPMCFAENSIIPKTQIRILPMRHLDAKGPTLARSRCESLFDNQDYYLLCDSHMRFEAGYDVELIDNVLRCPRPERTVLTIYPEGYQRVEGPNGTVTYKIAVRKGWRRERFKYFNNTGIAEFESVTAGPPRQIPEHVPFLGACFAFGPSAWMKDVPYPRDTPHLFFGEEVLLTARLFTRGWDLRGPRANYLYHLWVRDYRPTFMDHTNTEERDASIQKVKDVLMGVNRDPVFGLGTVRTKEEFWDYVGLDPVALTTTRPKEPFTLPDDWQELDDEFVVGPDDPRKYRPKVIDPKLVKNVFPDHGLSKTQRAVLRPLYAMIAPFV